MDAYDYRMNLGKLKKEVNKEFTHFDFHYTVDFLKLAYSSFKNA
jgi:hypothetical protein